MYTRLRNSEMTVLGGMQSSGKTWFAVDGAVRLARAGVPVFFVSAETGRTSLRQRLLSRVAEVDSLALRGERQQRLTSEEWRRLETASEELSRLPIYLDYTSLSAEDVLYQVEEALLLHNIPLNHPYVIFFDYLQFGSKIAGDQTEYDRVTRLCSEFKFLAKILEHPVVVLSQLKRDNEGDDTPEITWFKNTGRIESDMDVGLIITGERVSGTVAPRKVTIVKQREGVANVSVQFHLYQPWGKWEVVGKELTPVPLLFEEGEGGGDL